MTDKQSWFINKLLNELEKQLEYEQIKHVRNRTYFWEALGTGYVNRVMTSKKASHDIDILLFVKNNGYDSEKLNAYASQH